MSGEVELVLAVLPPEIRDAVSGLDPAILAGLEEIRLRVGQPLVIHASGCPGNFVAPDGTVVDRPDRALSVTAGHIAAALSLMTDCSMYTVDNDIRQGFLTLAGGHRVGISGQPVLERDRVAAFAWHQALAIRVARAVMGAAAPLAPRILCPRASRPLSTLVIGPPRSGKTTLLRDLARQLSDGPPGYKVGIVDERSELAACYRGIPQLDVGRMTDVLDRCPKAEGIMMMIRASSPDVVVTDELGRSADLAAVREAVTCGVAVCASVHGDSVEDVARRPLAKELLGGGAFELVAELAGGRERGMVRRILSGRTLEPDGRGQR